MVGVLDLYTVQWTRIYSRNLRLKSSKRLKTFSRCPVGGSRLVNLSLHKSTIKKPVKDFKLSASLERQKCGSSSKTCIYQSTEPSVATLEEGHGFWPRIKALFFYAWAFLLSIPICITMCVFFPVMLLLDGNKFNPVGKRLAKCCFRRDVYCAMNSFWGILSSLPFYQVKIEGKENLPSRNEAAVYVANHQSYLDIFALLQLNRPFKFISKASIFRIPFIGWCMLFAGYISVDRMDRKSQVQCLRDCQALISNGGSVLVFPEGTRSSDSEVHAFKKGAFSVAVNTGVPIVPISVTGSGQLMHKSRQLELYSGTVRIKIHPRIETKERDADALCKQTKDTIVSAV
eukprot:g8196.t1